nr:dihydroorotate dehydrogenase [uncultured Dethiosulfovibrio sp.]
MGRGVDDYSAVLTSVELIGEDVVYLRAKCPELACEVEPGQFILLRDPAWGLDPLLMRPFAVAGVIGDDIEILLQVVGKGTEMLAQRKPGDPLVVRGPMGRGFSKPSSSPVYVAGTLGSAPLLFARDRFGAGRFVLGVPNDRWESFVMWLKRRCPELEVFSDDGSLGTKGNSLKGLNPEDGISVMACGPGPMMAAMANMGLKDCQVSMESRMACGIGACSGCVIETSSGKKRVCADGPVFDLQEVVWNG